MLQFNYNFSGKFCDTEKHEELGMDTNSLYLALSEKNLKDIVLPEKRNKWEAIRSRDCTDSFIANATGSFFAKTCCTAHMKHDKRQPGLSKEEFRCSEMLCLCSKTYFCYDRKGTKYKFRSKGKKNSGRLWKWHHVKVSQRLEKAFNVTSTTRRFRKMKHIVATYEQTKKGLSYFYIKRLVEEDEYILNL